MADDCDRAEERQEEVLADALAEVRRKPSLVACGRCYYCGEEVHTGKLFCDATENECAKDYEYEQRLKKMAGR